MPLQCQPVALDRLMPPFDRRQTVANLVVVEVGANAKVDLFNAAGFTDVVIDVVGWDG